MKFFNSLINLYNMEIMDYYSEPVIMSKRKVEGSQGDKKNDATSGSNLKANPGIELNEDTVFKLSFEKFTEINSEWLRYFYILCREKNFTAATKVLNITPQALSKAISGIESQLGIKLIERDKGFKGLTESGEVFLENTRKIIGSLFAIENNFEQIKQNEPQGTIKLGWLSLTGGKLLSMSAGKFLEKYPRIDFQINYVSAKNLFRYIYDNKIDIGISPEEILNERLFCIARLPLRYVIAGKPQKKKNWDEFSYIIPNTSLSVSGMVSSLMWPEAGFDRKIVMQSGSILFTVEMCKRGIGAGFFPEILIRDELKKGELAIVAETPFPSEKSLYIYGKNNIYNNALMADFIRQLKTDIKLLSGDTAG